MLKPGKVAPGATPRAHPVGLAAYCMHNPSFKPPGMAQVGPGAAFVMHACNMRRQFAAGGPPVGPCRPC